MKHLINSLLCFLCITGMGYAQSGKKGKTLLTYERVNKDSLGVSYEQRIYRNPFNGFVELRYSLSDTSSQRYIPLFQGVPIASYQKIGSGIYSKPLSASASRQVGVNKWFPLKDYKLDFSLLPLFTAKFGNFDNPVEAKFSVALNTQLILGRGLAITTGLTIPIVNDLDQQSLRLRLAPTFINKFLTFRKFNFMSLSAGLFYKDQYGLNAQYRYFDVNSPWSFGLEGSFSGYYRISGDYFEYQSLRHLMVLGDVSYRIFKNDITLKLSGGQYLYNDRGVRFDFIRQFSNVEIGFYALKTTNGTSVGFNFAIPIPPGVILQGKRVRLRTADEFRWEYLYVKGYQIAERYRTGYQLDEKLRTYHSSYWDNQLKRGL
ncbi:YjbH domain-containing protein [Emticicia fluvialis]|uniref:YjbH domain-containing protein n=1 Tax=Emticicia fluvialis TaxID=2974474 RepID=UPI0021659CF4|nr:YjbH domain-containing protein [Emticicia fluvialis]